MREITFFSLLLISLYSSGQIQENEIVVLDLHASYKPAWIEIFRDSIEIGEFVSTEYFQPTRFRNLEPGYYHAKLSWNDQDTVYSDTVEFKLGQFLQLHFDSNARCLYNHPSDYFPVCSEGHTDGIIPIIYGKIALRRSKEPDEFLAGGCMVSDCDPKYYCKWHKTKF